MGRGWARRTIIMSALAAAIFTSGESNGALGSPGCDEVNAKAFDGDSYESPGGKLEKTVSGFSVGDVISVRISCGHSGHLWCSEAIWRAKLVSGNNSVIAEASKATDWAGATILHTVTGRDQDTTLTFTFWSSPYARPVSTGKCIPARQTRSDMVISFGLVVSMTTGASEIRHLFLRE